MLLFCAIDITQKETASFLAPTITITNHHQVQLSFGVVACVPPVVCLSARSHGFYTWPPARRGENGSSSWVETYRVWGSNRCLGHGTCASVHQGAKKCVDWFY